jgi:hypothetical protein
LIEAFLALRAARFLLLITCVFTRSPVPNILRLAGSLSATIAVAYLMTGGCSTTTQTLLGTAGSGGAGPSSGGGGLGARGRAGNGGAGGGSPPAVCTKSLADYCAGSTTGLCTATWDDALLDTTFCRADFDARYSCGAFNLREVASGENLLRAYYDVTTGALVAIWETPPYCLGGPVGSAEPSCAMRVSLSGPSCPDGGLDGAVD